MPTENNKSKNVMKNKSNDNLTTTTISLILPLKNRIDSVAKKTTLFCFCAFIETWGKEKSSIINAEKCTKGDRIFGVLRWKQHERKLEES